MGKISKWVLGTVIVIFFMLFLAGILFYHIQEKSLRKDAENQLQTIAQLKSDEIIAWRAERLGNAENIMERNFFKDAIPLWLRTQDTLLEEQLRYQFKVLEKNYGYSNLLLVEPDGKIRLSLNSRNDALDNEALQTMRRAFHSRQPEITELHLNAENVPHLGIVAPFFNANRNDASPSGAIILQINAERFLYPLLRSWPTPTETAETFLVSRENGNVLYLNELRHQKDTALRLRISVEQPMLPSAMAVKGQEGLVEGLDYRGIEVLAVLKAIPHSTWFLVAKIDKAEALAVRQEITTLIALLLFGLLVILSALLFGFWQVNEKLHYQKMFQIEHERRRAEERNRIILMSIGDGVIATDAQGRIELMNPVAEKLTGYQNETACGRFLTEVFQIINEETRERAENPVARVLREGMVVGLANHTLLISRTGNECPIADSGAPIFDENRQITGVVLVFRDQTEERAAEKALRQSEARYRKAQAMGHVGNWEYNLQTTHFWGSDEAKRIYGFDPQTDEFTTEEVENCIPERERVHQALVDFIDHGKEYNIEFEIHPKNSPKPRILISVAELVKDDAGRPLKVVGVVKDITEIKQAEIELRKSQNYLQRIFDVLPVGLWFADKNGTLLRGNPKGIEIWGAEPRVPIAKYGVFKARRLPSGQEIAPDDWALAHTIKQGTTTVNEMLEIEAFDGKIKTILNYTTPVLDEHGAIEGAIVVNLDITELHRAQQQLVESEMKFRNYVENAPDGIFVADEQGNFLEANQAAIRLTQYSREALLKMNLIDLVPPEMYDQAREHFGNVLAHDHSIGEVPYRPQNGEIRWWRVNAVKISENRFLGFANDITDRINAEEERNRLQDQLIQSQKLDAIGRLAGGVAHDFNNMLQAILGNADMALFEISPESPCYDNLLEIKKAASRSADLTHQLLAFARRQTVTPKVINLNDTVSGMLKMLRRLIGEDIDLVWRPGADLWNVKMDPSQIDQILANLAVNARDAISGVGKVTIETRNTVVDHTHSAEHLDFRPGEYVLLAISDTGCGMDKETVAEVFEPFFTTKKLGKGTGLGLATVYGIIKQNHGQINVYSEPGKGTIFKIYLPRFSEEASEPAALPAVQSTEHSGKETVLLVEDEKSILNMGKRLLKRLGYVVLIANTPAEAIEIARRSTETIHLLITDVIMPGMNGRELSRQLEKYKPGIKCLFMSGYTANVIAHHGVLEEGVHFLQKPFSLNELSIRVREALNAQTASN